MRTNSVVELPLLCKALEYGVRDDAVAPGVGGKVFEEEFWTLVGEGTNAFQCPRDIYQLDGVLACESAHFRDDNMVTEWWAFDTYPE